jgi:alpha,alpha-trehalose phosphorylase
MAAENMRNAAAALLKIQKGFPERYAVLKTALNIQDAEPEAWIEAAEKMYYPYDERLGVFGQDDTFLYKKPFDKDSIPKDKLPMLLHFHPLNVYRYRVAKQADLLFAMLLLGNRYTLEEKRRHFDFYEKLTLHDSSLSPCIFSILACDVGYYDKALAYFNMTSRLDLDDYHNNVYSGVHAANMAGTWMSITQGFAKMRVYDGELSFKPWIPKDWNSYSFKIVFRGRKISITVSHHTVDYVLLEGDPLTILSDDKSVFLKKEDE